MQNSIQPQKIDPQSLDIEASEREKLKSLFPQCFTEGKLNIDKLLNLCGEYIDNDFEKYNFEWKGKSDCYKIAGKRSMATLRPCPSESVDFDKTQNIYIEGDNLEVLKLLQNAYYRKVKMIYIDPPYNTGNDFVYEDDFKDPLARYKEITGQTTKSNPETMGRFHTNWLNMMYPRLRLASNLLRDDGVIFISIDGNEVHNLRKICDEVFGEENFVDDIIWQRAFSPKNDAKFFSSSHDFILVYAKNIENFQVGRLPRSKEANERYTNPDNDYRGIWISGDLTVKTYSAKYDYPIITPSGKIINPTQGRVWSVSKERFEELKEDNRIWFGADGNNVPRLKRFLSEVQDGMVATTLWTYQEVGHNQEGRQELKKLFDDKGYFDGPKPIRLLNRILQVANTKDDDIILDFFSGSGTTAHALMQLNAEDGGNRQFIMVQLPEITDEKSEAYKAGYKNICEIGKERIRRAGAKIIEANKNGQGALLDNDNKKIPDVGFKVFKLDSSNLIKWDDSPIPNDDIEILQARLDSMLKTVKEDRNDLDFVYEIMLKLGIPLTYSVNTQEINGKKIYSIGEESLVLICLHTNKESINADDVSAMCDLAPAKIIAAEQAFTDDIVMSNAYYITKDKGIEIELF